MVHNVLKHVPDMHAMLSTCMEHLHSTCVQHLLHAYNKPKKAFCHLVIIDHCFDFYYYHILAQEQNTYNLLSSFIELFVHMVSLDVQMVTLNVEIGTLSVWMIILDAAIMSQIPIQG